MIGLTIKGIRLESFHWSNKKGDGDGKISGSYSLISSADKVLAEQTVGSGYGAMELSPSPATLKAFDAFRAAYKSDIEALLGMPAE